MNIEALHEYFGLGLVVYIVVLLLSRRRRKGGGSEWREPTLLRLFIFLSLTLGAAGFAWNCTAYVRTHTGDIGAYLPLFGALAAIPLALGLALSTVIEALRFVFSRNR